MGWQTLIPELFVQAAPTAAPSRKECQLRIKEMIAGSALNVQRTFRTDFALSATRRTRGDRSVALLSCRGAPPISAAANAQMWKERDRERNRCARRQGSTGILATGNDTTAQGKRVGYVSKLRALDITIARIHHVLRHL